MSENALGEATNSNDTDHKEVCLEKFDSPGDHIAEFTTNELTALCPFDFGGPDYYALTLRYKPDGYVVESKSLKQYLESYRNTEISAEALACAIYEDVTAKIDPESCYLRLEQARRGGIEETVEAGEYELRR